MFKHILIPTDGSEVAAKAVKAGVAFARETGARITAFYALEPLPSHIYGEGYIADRKLVAEFETRARAYAEAAVETIGAAARKAGVPFQGVVERSVVPYRAIIETAKKKKCDAIFMASHGHRGIARLVIGSVTHKVLSHSDIPVLVFR